MDIHPIIIEIIQELKSKIKIMYIQELKIKIMHIQELKIMYSSMNRM
jgi:hypothetical protein